eukprot:c9323_g1_i2.p1 GENE.c9323_g1_i2~~c9323_g1_i2.p1  ORF type:complete len:446 (+),score=59.67 c9323_g1_i2:514-1851(+)
MTPLHAAAAMGRIEVVKALLDLKLQRLRQSFPYGGSQQVDLRDFVNRPDNTKRTALLAASSSGHLSVIELLKQHGADLHHTDSQHKSAIYLAADHGHTRVVEFLAENGCDVNSKTFQTEATPLLIACWRGHVSIVQVLLRFGAITSQRCKGGATPFYIACQEGFIDIVRILIASSDINVQLDNGATSCFVACWRGYFDIVQLLVDRNCNLEFGLNGCTPLLIASQEANYEIVHLLLTRGAHPDSPDSHGYRPLWLACYRGDPKTAKLLCEFGANTSLTCDASTPLFVASHQGHLSIVRFLVELGADPNVPRGQVLPFEIAVLLGHVEVAHFLASKTRHLSPVVSQLRSRLCSDHACANLIRVYAISNSHKFRVSLDTVFRMPAVVVSQGILSVLAHLKTSARSMLSFCMSAHPRLGAESPAHFLPNDLRQKIYHSLLEKAIFEEQ